ncbi:hypothetical protein SAMN05444920_14921 [Nonomuraea solani]|uniref:Uncharacterized protein n=1 Tax=Nonomuraea solani TaxID=1144553 RepID=A0A1H6F3J4_9ACTN|nr:hypothetical protein [Nonomuraea solani]SEH03951.1 hypothetical protein SAMN05444920_14921 [Nonomuraea solani]
MIHLSFSLPESDSPWLRTWERAKQGDPVDLPEIDLRYKYFGVNVEMVIDGVEVISKRRFVTLVDLALSLSHAKRRLLSGEDVAFGFTESEEVIRLRCDGDLIAVTSSKHPWRVAVEREELASAFSDFLREVHYYLTSEIPGLAANSVIRKILPE